MHGALMALLRSSNAWEQPTRTGVEVLNLKTLSDVFKQSAESITESEIRSKIAENYCSCKLMQVSNSFLQGGTGQGITNGMQRGSRDLLN
mmetsp:Transcript_8217/g.36655  ORF Transcript_8217/g.36655 Transcript_8217/m.36655 type:complete len:90 (-) Transcript_8217:11-280(-)